MQVESMPLRELGRGRPHFRWLVASALAALVSGCGVQDEGSPPPRGPTSKPVDAKPRSDQSAFVSAGGRVKSPKYVMDFVLGQSTQNQDQSTSVSYRARGGFIGGNGRAR